MLDNELLNVDLADHKGIHMYMYILELKVSFLVSIFISVKPS